MLASIKGCEISEESSSDNKNITLNLNLAYKKAQINNFLGTLYVTKGQHTEFHRNLFQQISKNFQIGNEGNIKEIDEKLNTSLTGQKDIDVFIEKIDGTMQSTCKKTFNYLNSPKTALKGEPVPRWTDALKIIRKRTSAPRRYQRTLNNEELRDNRKNQYIEKKKKYQAAIRKEKLMGTILQHNISE
jgi:hypothetical protein